MDLEYSDADYSNLTTYKLFQQTFRPRIQAENPKVPMSKLMMLVAAKWREFTSLGPAEEEEEGKLGRVAVLKACDSVDEPQAQGSSPSGEKFPKFHLFQSFF